MTELSHLTHADYAIKFCGKVRHLLNNKQRDAATRSMYEDNYPIRTYRPYANFVTKSDRLN